MNYLNWKHLSLFSTVTLKGSSYIPFGGKFFSTSSGSVLGGLSVFETRCSRVRLAATLEGDYLLLLFLLLTLSVCSGLRSDFFHAITELANSFHGLGKNERIAHAISIFETAEPQKCYHVIRIF